MTLRQGSFMSIPAKLVRDVVGRNLRVKDIHEEWTVGGYSLNSKHIDSNYALGEVRVTLRSDDGSTWVWNMSASEARKFGQHLVDEANEAENTPGKTWHP